MSLFYFDLYDGEDVTRDRYGIELESMDEAAEQAAALLPDVVRDLLPARGARDFATFVRDANGSTVHRAALLYRAQTLSQDGVLAPDRGEAARIVTLSRETRARARQLSAKLDASVSDLLDAIRRSAEVIEETRASMNRICMHMK